MAAKADEVIPSYRLNSPTPTAEKGGRGELATVVKAEEGNILLHVIAVGQMVLASPERQTVYGWKSRTQTRVGWTRQLGKAAILGEEATLSKNLNRRNRMTQPTWRG